MRKKKLWNIFKNIVNQNKDRVAVKYSGCEYTYSEYFEDVNRTAEKLVNVDGIYNGNAIIIYAENSYVYACYVLACIKVGITVVPLSTRLFKSELDKIIRECEPKQIYTDQDWLLKEKGVLELKLGQVYEDSYIETDKYDETEIQFILFSSGSTGEMKGIECTEAGIIAATYSINSAIGNNGADNILCILDFSFDYGLYQLILALEVGATITICSTKDNMLRIPDYILKNQVTGFPATPFLLKMLFEARKINMEKLKSLRYITSTGDYLSPKLIDEYRALLPEVKIFPMYGLTECKRVSILAPEDYESHRNSVGKPLDCNKVKIIDANGKEVPCGTAGELVVIGTNVMKGYFKDVKLTKEKFVKNQEGVIELHTGDIFFMDEEGFLYFVNRTQNFIKIRERRISPLVIEQEIITIINGIIECLIVPFHASNATDEIFCFLRIAEGYGINDIIKEIAKRITRIHFPRFFCNYRMMFLHNSNGKIDRFGMMEKAKEIIDSGDYIEY